MCLQNIALGFQNFGPISCESFAFCCSVVFCAYKKNSWIREATKSWMNSNIYNVANSLMMFCFEVTMKKDQSVMTSFERKTKISI